MKKFITLLSLMFLVVTSLSFSQTGKISGKVIDMETGEPLIGANIIIEGTNLGSATNINGEYIIINIPPDTYTLIARYVGYKGVTQSNIKISVNVTTEVDFKLPSESYELGIVEIVAPKPLINKNLTNSVNIVRSEDIDNLPVRGVAAVVSTQTGVVSKDGDLLVRGSRQDAVAYYVDGVLVNNPVFGGAQTFGIQNAIQEIQFQAGGYPAEYGGANAGIITTTSKIGGEKYKFSFEGITDGFNKVGNKFLDTYSYGYSELVFTLSGPIIPSYKNLKFFVAGNNIFNKTDIGYYREINFPGLYNPVQLEAYNAAIRNKSATLPNVDTIDVFIPGGYVLNNHQNTYNLQGNILWDFNPFSVKLNGSYKYSDGRNGDDLALTSFRTANRAGLNESQTITSSMKFTHVLSDKAFYEVMVNYFNDFFVDMDPIFKHDIAAYGDSIKNAQVGTTLRGDGQFLQDIQVYEFNFRRAERPFNLYSKQRTEDLAGQINLLYQIGQNHEFKTGGEFKYYTIRRYRLGPFSIAGLKRSIPDGQTYELYNRPDNYGYDVTGNETNEGLDAPRHPVFASYYLQDKMEFSDLVINAGLRFDYIDTDGEIFKNPSNIQFTEGDRIDPESLEEVEPFMQVSPRLGFSFPVSDKTVFHAQYGKFIQQSRLRDVYQGYNLVADNIKGGFAIETPVGFGLRPERTTQYEIGFKQQIGETFAFNVTGFYKDIKDQVQIRPIYAETGANHRQYYAFVNADFSTVKGVELSLELRRTERVAATIDYTFSDAQGTGSNPSSSFRQIWQSPTATPFFPQQIAPLDFNQAHRGFLNIDYRFLNDDGPSLFGAKILQNLGANLLFSFTSGFNFTRWDNESYGNRRFPIEPLNASTTPWTFQLDLKVDKTFKIAPFDFNIYLWVINVLNTQNVVNVFNISGDAYDDGWLTSPQGITTVEAIRTTYGNEKAEQYQELYKALNYDADNFGPPRQIRLGVRLNY